MLQLVARRLFLMVFVLILVATLTFFLTRLIPGDPARMMAGDFATHEVVEKVRHELGLDQPLLVQYAKYMVRLAHGDLGRSIHSRRPVLDDIADYFPATFELTILTMVLAISLGLPLGVVSAVKRGSLFDEGSRFIALSGVSTPVFWLALLLQLLFSNQWGLLPLGGRLSTALVQTGALQPITGMYAVDAILQLNWVAFVDAFRHLILPALTLGFASVVTIARMTRANMLEVLRQDYIRTARASGLSERTVIYKYALKNALIPTITTIGLVFGRALAGAVLVESVFSWPGLGRYAAISILESDYPAVIGVTLISAAVYTVLNLLVDIAYTFIDPRIRYA